MHLCNCINPQKVFVNNEYRNVPCGKCIVCRSSRSFLRTQKLKLEIQSHKFGVFGTLTYSDMFLPRMIFDSNIGGLYVPDDDTLDCTVTECSGLFIPFKIFNCDKKTLNYLNSCMNLRHFIPVLRKYDVQKFFKRLRININRYIISNYGKKESIKITYAVCGEYGPTTFRPHYHFIFLFDDERLQKDIFKIIHKSWPYGSSKSRFLQFDEDGGYLSKYLNSIDNLPSVFKVREICPFFLASKSHPLGIGKVSKEEIQKLLFTCSPVISVFDDNKGKSANVPLWNVLENWFFPKFTGFSCISDRCKSRLLGIACCASTFKEFVEIMQNSNLQSFNDWFCEVGKYYYSFEVYSYLSLFYRDAASLEVKDKRIFSCLKSIYYCAKRIVRNMHLYCIDTIDDYLQIIDRYYHNKALYKLSLQFEFEDLLMKRSPHLIEKLDLDYFSDDVFDDYDFRTYVDKLRTDVATSHKNKAKQEYLILHPEYRLIHSSDDFQEGFV